jgi:hypothetical protein
MPTKSLHGVTLWAVPRFHRSEITPEKADKKSETGKSETTVEWVGRLRTYSFSLGQDGEAKRPSAAGAPDQPETCH